MKGGREVVLRWVALAELLTFVSQGERSASLGSIHPAQQKTLTVYRQGLYSKLELEKLVAPDLVFAVQPGFYQVGSY